MIAPAESLVDDLVARATVETYGDISIIAVPGVETLPESQRITVLKKAEQRLISDHPDADDLQLRLQTITPPPDEEEDDEESRLLEAQARQDLESDGCPPCYPPRRPRSKPARGVPADSGVLAIVLIDR
ncbi:hypothetical protein MFIFM68171_02187 [Madurella fahalii]|uniref:Uncharacterized protein n=1 Tax=Madurella fahalii TaxID=1157608 RepID=A0ABQ0G2I3_9PEZI